MSIASISNGEPMHDVRAAGPDVQYAAALVAGRWQVQRCNACRQVIFFPRTACPHCGAADYAWFTPSGRGSVYSTTVMRRPAKAGGDLHLCLIDLEEGFRMMGRVAGADPAGIAIGDPVTAYIGETVAADGSSPAPLVLFRRTEGQQ